MALVGRGARLRGRRKIREEAAMAVGHSVPQETWRGGKAPKAHHVALQYEGALPKPTQDVEQIKKDLAAAGYAIYEAALSQAEAMEVRGILEAELRREEALSEDKVRRFYTDPDDKNRRLQTLPDRHKWFQDLLEHPLALELTRHMLGSNIMKESYLVHSYGANITRPGSGQQFIHKDRSSKQAVVQSPLQSRFIWCLDDFTEENGATRMVPGSQHWPADLTGATTYESVPAEAPRGSLLIYDDRILHGTGANLSADKERAGIIVGYTPPWCRPMVHFPSVLDPEKMKDSSATVRQLLGYSSVVVGFDAPWEYARPEVRDLVVPPKMNW
jgi:ectoine hydroxylase-related dioxygenase (phytanoyl-CoA dioxygenase family)